MRSTAAMVALAVIALTAAAAGAMHAWQKNGELERTKRELAGEEWPRPHLPRRPR
jgi:hypothetical protein